MAFAILLLNEGPNSFRNAVYFSGDVIDDRNFDEIGGFFRQSSSRLHCFSERIGQALVVAFSGVFHWGAFLDFGFFCSSASIVSTMPSGAFAPVSAV